MYFEHMYEAVHLPTIPAWPDRVLTAYQHLVRVLAVESAA